jgi:hypothetical protein
LLRGVGVDSAYLTGFVEALRRPVVLVAHSYAGAVISQTGSDASNVAGLGYVAAYAPEAGETLGALPPLQLPPLGDDVDAALGKENGVGGRSVIRMSGHLVRETPDAQPGMA